MTKPLEFEMMGNDTIVWTANGPMRLVLVPVEIEPAEVPRIVVVGKFWLSKREFKVGCLLRTGVTRKEMAHDLGLSDDVVGNDLDQLYTKLGARNGMQACSILGRYGGCGF